MMPKGLKLQYASQSSLYAQNSELAFFSIHELATPTGCVYVNTYVFETIQITSQITWSCD